MRTRGNDRSRRGHYKCQLRWPPDKTPSSSFPRSSTRPDPGFVFQPFVFLPRNTSSRSFDRFGSSAPRRPPRDAIHSTGVTHNAGPSSACCRLEWPVALHSLGEVHAVELLWQMPVAASRGTWELQGVARIARIGGMRYARASSMSDNEAPSLARHPCVTLGIVLPFDLHAVGGCPLTCLAI